MATILRCPKYWLKKWWREWLQGSEPTLRTKEDAWKRSSRYLAKDMFQLSMLIGTSGVAYKRFIVSISLYWFSCFIKEWILWIIWINTVECKIKHTLLSIQIKFISNHNFNCRKMDCVLPFFDLFWKKINSKPRKLQHKCEPVYISCTSSTSSGPSLPLGHS